MKLFLLSLILWIPGALTWANECPKELLQILSGAQPESHLPVQESLDATHFRFYDPDGGTAGKEFLPQFKFYADVSEEQILDLNIASSVNGVRSKRIYAQKMFDQMMTHFANEKTEIRAIRGLWVHGSNLDEVNRLAQEGYSLSRSARETWTGRQAARHGYTHVEIIDSHRDRFGNYISVNVLFRKPRSEGFKERLMKSFFK